MSGAPEWIEHRLDVGDHRMAWYECGAGPTVVFLHGSYDHLLYRPMAGLFVDRCRCVLYDQRGAGNSTLPDLTDDALHLDKALADIERLREHLGLERLSIAGHSWGATLGLFYGGKFPERVERLALLCMGPISDEMSRVYHANVLRLMRPADRERWAEVNGHYRAAWRSGGVPRDIDEANIRAWSPVMFYFPEHAERFVAEYLAAGGWRRHAPGLTGFRRDDVLVGADRITAPVLVLYGYQDYESITQAYALKARIPHARLVFLNECGHMVWRDQPAALVKELGAFLGD